MSAQDAPGSNMDWAERLQGFLDEHIPLTRAIQLRVASLDDSGLRLEAPLAPNVNDKGTAFGGSLASLLTLAGWGLLWTRCQQSGWNCDIVIHRGEIRREDDAVTNLFAGESLPFEVLAGNTNRCGR